MKYTEEQIDAYLRGEMSDSEKRSFETEMANDTSLVAQVNLMQSIVQGLKSRQEKEEAVSVWQKEREHERLHRPWLPWVTAYASAAAIVAVAFLFQPSSPVGSKPYQEETPATTVSGMRGADIFFNEGIEQESIDPKRYDEILERIDAEIAQNKRLLQMSVQRRKEADYEVKKYEYAIRQLEEQRQKILSMKDSKASSKD